MQAELRRDGPAAAPKPVDEQPTVFPSRYQVGLVAVLGAILLVALAPRQDTDLWWHLKDGAYIWSHHTVPRADIFSFTFLGHAWVDHEWLTELLLYGLYSAAGHWGPIVFFALVICATFGLVYARMAAFQVNRILGLFVLSMAFFASSSTWGARPQMLTLFFLAAFSLCLEIFLRVGDPRPLYILPPLMVLWANLHGGWVLGIVLLGVTLLGESINRGIRAQETRLLGTVTLLCLLATFINPNGISQVLYPLVWIVPTPYANVLNEWVSPDFHQPVYIVFEGMLLLLIGSLFVRRSRANWTHIFLVVVFTYLALAESRNVAVWSVVIAPLVALYLQRALQSRETDRPPVSDQEPVRRRATTIPRRTQRTMNLAMLVLVLSLYPIEAFHYISNRALTQNERTQFPAAASTYLARHGLPANTFTNYAWGGYLIWRLYPRYRDFIDGRANTLFDARILSDYLTASSGGSGWKRVLDKRHVGTVLISPGSPLSQVLREDPGWRLVYRDGTSVVFARRGVHGVQTL